MTWPISCHCYSFDSLCCHQIEWRGRQCTMTMGPGYHPASPLSTPVTNVSDLTTAQHSCSYFTCSPFPSFITHHMTKIFLSFNWCYHSLTLPSPLPLHCHCYKYCIQLSYKSQDWDKKQKNWTINVPILNFIVCQKIIILNLSRESRHNTDKS